MVSAEKEKPGITSRSAYSARSSLASSTAACFTRRLARDHSCVPSRLSAGGAPEEPTYRPTLSTWSPGTYSLSPWAYSSTRYSRCDSPTDFIAVPANLAMPCSTCTTWSPTTRSDREPARRTGYRCNLLLFLVNPKIS